MTRRAVFLDRDGVLVETFVRDNRPYAVTSIDDFRMMPTAAADVARLRLAGLRPIVVTNQPEVGRGIIAPAMLAEMHARLCAAVALDAVLVCPHVPEDRCACRKPKPGLLDMAATRWSIDVRRSFMVGDRSSDIEAGRAAGCFTVLIERSYSGRAQAHARVASLREAVDRILSRMRL